MYGEDFTQADVSSVENAKLAIMKYSQSPKVTEVFWMAIVFCKRVH